MSPSPDPYPGLPRIRSVVHHRGIAEPSAPHVYHHHVIACHVRANGAYRFGRERIDAVRAPYLCLLAAGEDDENSLHGPIEQWWCLFDWEGPRAGPGAQVSLSPTLARGHLHPLPTAELAGVVSRFRELRALSRSADPAAPLVAGARLLELLAAWGADDAGPVDRYRRLIEEHACRAEIPLSALAARIGIGEGHLSALFARRHGLTPIAFRSRARLLLARGMLADGATVAETARRTGYDDPKYFSRAFRRAFGMPPGRVARERPGAR